MYRQETSRKCLSIRDLRLGDRLYIEEELVSTALSCGKLRIHEHPHVLCGLFLSYQSFSSSLVVGFSSICSVTSSEMISSNSGMGSETVVSADTVSDAVLV